jgi:hypothetical protein
MFEIFRRNFTRDIFASDRTMAYKLKIKLSLGDFFFLNGYPFKISQIARTVPAGLRQKKQLKSPKSHFTVE